MSAAPTSVPLRFRRTELVSRPPRLISVLPTALVAGLSRSSVAAVTRRPPRLVHRLVVIAIPLFVGSYTIAVSGRCRNRPLDDLVIGAFYDSAMARGR